MSNETVLRMEGIRKVFSGVVALDNVELTLKRGEVHSLVGENGAGKSTLIKVMTGAYSRDGGEIYLEGTPVNFRSPQGLNGMAFRRLLAQSVVTDLEVAERWYAALFDSTPQARPMDGLIEWHLGQSFGVQVWLDPTRAGRSSMVIDESDLDALAVQHDKIAFGEEPGVTQKVFCAHPLGRGERREGVDLELLEPRRVFGLEGSQLESHALNLPIRRTEGARGRPEPRR